MKYKIMILAVLLMLLSSTLFVSADITVKNNEVKISDLTSMAISTSNVESMTGGDKMIIITTEDFKSGFQPLADYHNSYTDVETYIEVIYQDATPADVKNFIRDAYENNGVNYVLLGGDSDFIPVHYKLGFSLYPEGIPSDQWYANLDDSVLDAGDVYIGRACVDTEQDVQNFVSKTISYMSGNEDDYYKVLMVGENLGFSGDSEWGGNYMDKMIDGFKDNNFCVNTLYDRDSKSWPREELITEINDGVSIINHLGHSGYNYNMRLYKIDIDLLKNTAPFFMYSQGCHAGGFDNREGSDCIAEVLTVKTEYGPFAGIFNTRFGIGSGDGTVDGISQRFHKEFWNTVFDDGITEVGKAHQFSKNIDLNDEPFHMRYIYWGATLFGDPAVKIKIPNVQIPTAPSKPNGIDKWGAGVDQTYTVNDLSQPGLIYKFGWGDGSRSSWLMPTGDTLSTSYRWDEEGDYLVRVKAKNSQGYESPWSEGLLVNIYPNPYVTIEKPKKHGWYRNNEETAYTDLEDCVVIGWIEVQLDANSTYGINKIEIYFDGELKATLTKKPYTWKLEEEALGQRTLKVVVEDTNGEQASDEIKIWFKSKKERKSFFSSFKNNALLPISYNLLSRILNNHPNLYPLLQQFLQRLPALQ